MKNLLIGAMAAVSILALAEKKSDISDYIFSHLKIKRPLDWYYEIMLGNKNKEK